MPTEDDARRLLAKAAATIEVDETAPMTLTGLPEPRPRHWPVLAAAAAVVLAIGGGYLVAQQLGEDVTTMDQPDGTNATDLPTNQPSLPGDDNRLPSMIGYTEDEAIELLQARGYPVTVNVVPDGCDVPGIVTGTRPPVGTPLVAGTTPVTITVVGQQTVIDCVGEVPMDLVWDVVRAARGLAIPVSLGGADFPDDVRAAVGDLVDAPREDGLGPRLVARWARDPHPCFPGSGSVDGVRFWMEYPTDVQQFCPASAVLFDYRGGSITSVRVEETEGGGAPPVLSEEREESAAQFVAWARDGGPAPGFADRVRVLFFGGPGLGHPGWTEEPESLSQYAGCSGLGFPDCGVDPVGLLFRTPDAIVATAGRGVCGYGDHVPPRLAEAEHDAVSLSTVIEGDCAALVELWIDEDGEIYAVNQAGAPF